MEEFGKDLLEDDNDDILFQMKWALREKDYMVAFSYARMLERTAFMTYKDDILLCIGECAETGRMINAAIWMMDWYVAKSTGKMAAEAFPFLKLLADVGYVRSFRWIADCYYLGDGCARDERQAARYYLEGLLFGQDVLCMERCRKLYSPNESIGDDHPIKKLINELIWGNNEDMARERIATLILDGVISDYKPQAGAFLLKICASDYGESYGLAAWRLVECFANGIGTEQNLLLAFALIEMAVDELKYLPGKDEEEWQSEFADTPYGEIDFPASYLAAESMRQEVLKRIREAYGYFDTEEVYAAYDEWCEKKEEFISRKAMNSR